MSALEFYEIDDELGEAEGEVERRARDVVLPEFDDRKHQRGKAWQESTR